MGLAAVAGVDRIGSERRVRLIAGMMVGTGERERYLALTVPALTGFCDAVVVVDESMDGSGDLAMKLGANVERTEPGSFFKHEGKARQLLLDVVFEQKPDVVLMVDADELVTDGAALRKACESRCPVQSLRVQEIWGADRTACMSVSMAAGGRITRRSAFRCRSKGTALGGSGRANSHAAVSPKRCASCTAATAPSRQVFRFCISAGRTRVSGKQGSSVTGSPTAASSTLTRICSRSCGPTRA